MVNMNEIIIQSLKYTPRVPAILAATVRTLAGSNPPKYYYSITCDTAHAGHVTSVSAWTSKMHPDYDDAVHAMNDHLRKILL